MGVRENSISAIGRTQPIAYADNRNRVDQAGLSDEFWKYQADTRTKSEGDPDDPCLFLIQCEDEDERLGLEIGTTYQNWLTAL